MALNSAPLARLLVCTLPALLMLMQARGALGATTAAGGAPFTA